MHHYHHHAQTLARALNQRQRVLLTMTKDPDGDSVGSMFAMSHALAHLGKDVTCYSPDPIPPMFSYLNSARPALRELSDTVHDYQVVIIFDTGDMKRTPLVPELVERDPEKTIVINIDHHPTVTEWNGRSAVDHNIVDTSAGATTEMLHHLFEALEIPMNQHAATCLLTGILTDTGHFTNNGTSLRSLDIAAQLMARGAKHHTITQATMRNKSLGTLKLWGLALSRLTLNQETGMVSTVLTLKDFEDCGVDHKAGGGISNFLNGLNEGKMALVLHEEPGGRIKGSLRTTRPDVNVADFAAQFGGGGHPKAAGFSVEGSLVETKHGWEIQPLAKSKPA
jgi:phosphoesterase RecJ-like protein